MSLLYEDETYKIIGAAMEVHNELGQGFLEAVYQEAFEKELAAQNISYKREVSLPIYYKNALLNKCYIADFICYGKIIIELKALSELNNIHRSQVINYLKATKLKLGLLLNFGSQKLEHERIIRENPRTSADKDEKSPRITQINTDEENPKKNIRENPRPSADKILTIQEIPHA